MSSIGLKHKTKHILNSNYLPQPRRYCDHARCWLLHVGSDRLSVNYLLFIFVKYGITVHCPEAPPSLISSEVIFHSTDRSYVQHFSICEQNLIEKFQSVPEISRNNFCFKWGPASAACISLKVMFDANIRPISGLFSQQIWLKYIPNCNRAITI